ncbi:GNAT family N-acetyltransferase [Candidatus Sumerlaeota bacterium]|nr:GNAT family N-acetyltransferase [Candidatus Sumerlaeota bacterium]
MSDHTPSHSTFLVGERVTLRPLEPADVPMLSRAANDPETRYPLFRFLPCSDEAIRRQIEEWDRDPHTVMLAICERPTGRAIGNTGLVRIDWVSGAAIFFIAIADPEDWSKGFGGEATRLISDYAFDTLNLQRIQLHVWAKNERGVKAYQRAGFEIEGTLRRAMYHAGEHEDFLVMAKLRPM